MKINKTTRQVNNVVASVDIDLTKGFKIGDLTIKKIGDQYELEAKEPQGAHANEFIRTKDPEKVIKALISRASNWVSSRQLSSRQVNSDLSKELGKIDKAVKDKGYEAIWNPENDCIEIKGKDSDLVTIVQSGSRYILSNYKEVVYISSDLDKIIEELPKQLGKN